MGCKIPKRSPDRDHAPSREDFSSAGWDLLWSVNVPNLKSRYEAINGGAKCTNWGSLEHLGVTEGHGQRHRLIERIRLPIGL